MPLEIRELVIKTTVSGDASSGGGQSTNTSANSGENRDREIAMIVEKVLQVLKEKTER